MVLYEYPFHEGIRTMLRLEHLFDWLGQLLTRNAPVDHHFALATMFEIVEVASRADLKADLLKELDRHRLQLEAYRGNPAIAEEALEAAITRLGTAFDRLNQTEGKAGAALTGNEWLMTLRSRISIPGGTCEFDLPSYHAWQHQDIARRRADLLGWIGTLMPLGEALRVLLGMLRDAGIAQKVVATNGVFQQTLPAGRVYNLMRVRLPDEAQQLVPEITAHRLMVSVRLMQPDADGRLRPAAADTSFELTLCS